MVAPLTNDLDELVMGLPPAAEQSPLPRQWVWVDRGNLDELPERLCPNESCPKCGSVWVEYLSVGFRVPEPRLGCPGGTFYREEFRVVPVYYDKVPVSAVRLRCAEGHDSEFDGEKFWAVPSPLWTSAILGLVVPMAAAAAYYMALRK